MNKELLKRYTPGQQFEILKFFKVLAERTRKSNRISDSRQENIIKDWVHYDPDVVLDSLRRFMEMRTSAAQNEKYVRGIMRNKQREKEAGLGGKSRGGNQPSQKSNGGTECSDEGARLQGLTAGGAIKGADLECDF